MIVDNLKSCYSTQALVRLSPPLTATIRWFWAPPGALLLPTETAFGSSVWETGESDRVYPQPGLGEVSLVRTWDKGDAPPGVTGQATPTPLSWYVDGVPAGVAGGLAPCPGSLPAGPLLWWRPEELGTQAQGAAVAKWPHAPTTLIDGLSAVGYAAPTYQTDGPTGWAGLVLNALYAGGPSNLPNVLRFQLAPGPVTIGTGATTWFVFRVGPETYGGGPLFQYFAPLLYEMQWGPGTQLLGYSGLAHSAVSGLTRGNLECGCVLRAGGSSASLLSYSPVGGEVSAVISGTDYPAANQTWSSVSVDAGGAGPGSTLLLEVIHWPRTLSAAEQAAVESYLTARYAGIPLLDPTDMLIGQILWDAGADAVPPKCLLCDGSAVSRSTFSLLFGRLGTTYGAGDGSTTFNLPNIVGKIIYGAGGVYHAGQAVGADAPTLVANQLPAHTHPVTDPGHVHAQNTLGLAPLAILAAGGEAIGAGTDRATSVTGTTGSAATGLTVGNNVTTGSPLDVRQAGVALRPLIYAGV